MRRGPGTGSSVEPALPGRRALTAAVLALGVVVLSPGVASAAPSTSPATPPPATTTAAATSTTPTPTPTPTPKPTPTPTPTPKPTPTPTPTPTPKPTPAPPALPPPTSTGPDPAHVSAATARVEAVTAALDALARQLAAAQATVTRAQQESAIALDRYEAQQQAYEDAEVHAGATNLSAQSAGVALRHAREELAAFARSSYIDGSTSPGAASLFESFTSGGPDQFIERSVLLGEAGANRADVLRQVALLQERTSRADAEARAAVARAATLKKRAADALAVAQRAEQVTRERRAQLTVTETTLRQQLAVRQAELAGLIGPDAAAAVVAHARIAAAAHAGGPPLALGVLLGNRSIAGAGFALAAQEAIVAALAYVGTPYAWGGGGAAGPGPGLPPDLGVVGFDCSGLTQYAYAQAGIPIPRNSRAQYAALPKVATKDLRAGDLVFWALDPKNPDTIHHVAIYLGGGQVLQSPESGEVVTVSPMSWDGYAGAVRPGA